MSACVNCPVDACNPAGSVLALPKLFQVRRILYAGDNTQHAGMAAVEQLLHRPGDRSLLANRLHHVTVYLVGARSILDFEAATLQHSRKVAIGKASPDEGAMRTDADFPEFHARGTKRADDAVIPCQSLDVQVAGKLVETRNGFRICSRLWQSIIPAHRFRLRL